MKPYYTPPAIFLDAFAIANDVVAAAPTWTCVGLLNQPIRCHELARAVRAAIIHDDRTRERVAAEELSVLVIDGTYLEQYAHTWLGLVQQAKHAAAILDVYAVGQLPQVQLHDATFTSLARAFRPYPAVQTRTDIDKSAVTEIFRCWVNAEVSS